MVPGGGNDRVYGVLFRVGNEEYDLLAESKGANKVDPVYEKVKVEVRLGMEEEYKDVATFTVVQGKRGEGDVPPSVQYKECLVRGAEEQGLPEDYVARVLKAVKDNGSAYRRKSVQC